MKHLSLILAGLAVLVFALPLEAVLQFDRGAIAAGEMWRVITCQWTHWSLNHLFWDAAVFVALGVLCEQRDRRLTLRVILTSAMLIPLVVAITHPSMQFFRGLSGIDCALAGQLITMCSRDAWRAGRRGKAMAIASVGLLFVAKTVAEIATGSAMFVQSEDVFAVVPAAHIAGFAIGVLWSLLPVLREKVRMRVISFFERRSQSEITLTPTLSRSTGRGSRITSPSTAAQTAAAAGRPSANPSPTA